jgi:hypothetical protein
MFRRVAWFERLRRLGSTSLTIAGVFLASCTRDVPTPTAIERVTPSGGAEQSVSAREIRLTPEEAKALLVGHIQALPWTQAGAQSIELRRSMNLTANAPISLDMGSESMVTASGTFGAASFAEITTTGGPLAAWSSETVVTDGFARRVHLTTTGVYSQSTVGGYRQKQFSDVCGDLLSDLFRQHCNLGTVYLDIECYYTNGSINVSSQHAVDWLLGVSPPRVSSKSAYCRTAPTAHFTLSVGSQSGNDGETVTGDPGVGGVSVSATNSVAGSGSITDYQWKLNGQNWGTGASLSATVDPGTYTVGLTVKNSDNLTGSASATLIIRGVECTDPAANNYGETGECTYTPQVCWDPEANNYGQEGDCTYDPPNVCWDPEASNYGAEGDCTYPPPPQYCEDPSADNYGSIGDCTYSDPNGDPGPGGDGGGGDPDDPCYWDPWSPECTGIGNETSRLPGTHFSLARSNSRTGNIGTPRVRPYYVVLVDRWADPSLLAMVGRFRHGSGFVDAIYLPSAHPTARGWGIAYRALQIDRAQARDSGPKRRVIRLFADGRQDFKGQSSRRTPLSPTRELSPSTLVDLDSQFRSGILGAIRHVSQKSSKHFGPLKLMKWPHK